MDEVNVFIKNSNDSFQAVILSKDFNIDLVVTNVKDVYVALVYQEVF